MFVCCECCVLLGRGLCDELIIRLEESYRLWCVVVWDLKTSKMRRPWPALGRSATKKKLSLCFIRFNIQKFLAFPTEWKYVFFVMDIRKWVITSLFSINWFVLGYSRDCVYCAVCTEYVNVIQVNLWRLELGTSLRWAVGFTV